MESKKLSCGVIVIHEGKVLIQHVSEQPHWDIPKGTQIPGETTRETAIRELAEESGIKVSGDDILELGWYEYNRFKDLFLFMYKADKISLNSLSCSSTFKDSSGISRKEADDYRLVDLDRLTDYTCNSMTKLLDRELLKHIKIEISR